MTDTEKLTMLKSLLEIEDNSQDDRLDVYLKLSAQEIISWLYSCRSTAPEGAAVPEKYEASQIMACVTAYSISGAEGETNHSENGISRTWKYSDMVDYIRAHVVPLAGVVA